MNKIKENGNRMLYGITDIGSNTIRFKVYKINNGRFRTLISKKKTVGLISFKENNKLNKEGINRLIRVLRTFKKNMSHLQVDKTFYFATASLRNIDNTEEVLTQVKSNTNIDIHVLTGKQEATLSFKSLKNKELRQDHGLLIDVGGGSSEIIEFKYKQATQTVSLPLGSLNTYYDFVSLLLPNEKETKEIEAAVLKEIKKSQIKQKNDKHMYAVGGTIRTIKKIMEHLNIKPKGPTITIDEINNLQKELNGNNKETYSKILKIKAERIHTVVTGLIIIKTIANYFQVKEIHVSQNTIREGVIKELISDENE